jgi:cytochrome c peroxidase
MPTRILSTVLTLSLAASASIAAETSLEERARQLMRPLPARFDSESNPITPGKVALGKLLYFDARLSKNHDVSCNSCHDLAKYGVDAAPTSTGHKKQKGDRNAPTVYNAGAHFAQFWDGRAKDLEEQAKGPVLNPVEMAMADAASVEAVVASIPGYAPLFAKAFPKEEKPITYDNIAKAIGDFERTLVTPSKVDAFLAGKSGALNVQEKAGLSLFLEVGCITCHNGPALGGGMYQKLGLVAPFPNLKDEGRAKVSKSEDDRFVFKVPSLRNIEKTGPYLHDGSVAKLEEVVTLMGRHQLGRELKPEEVKSLVTFLKALTGPLAKASIAPPKPLPSGKNTPKPDPS